MIITHCKKCGKEIKKAPSRIKHGRGKFCSRSCSSKFNLSGSKNPNFGKKLSEEAKKIIRGKRALQIIKHSDKTKLKMSRAHLGKKCPWVNSKGKNNPAYIDGRARDRKYGAGFTERLKRKIRNKFGDKCFVCGKIQTKEKLSIHHIDYDKENNHIKNLVALCRSCHTITNFNRDKWIKFFKE